MPTQLLPALAAYMPRDRVEAILQPDQGLSEDGVALIADISGFTPLTEALTQGLSSDQGAEELTRALEKVFTPLIEEIHRFRGSVIKFGGDALIVWYGREPRVRRAAVIRRALTSAWRMQQAIKIHGRLPTPIGEVILRMKVGLTYGSVKRFNLGLPGYGYEDILGGATLDRMAEAEHQAEPGDIMVDAATLAYLPDTVRVTGWRADFAAIGQLLRPARPKPWLPLQWHPRAEKALVERFMPYLPAQIYDMLVSGQTQVAELRPVISLFVQFHGIEYDTDPAVGDKLQTYFITAQRVVARYGGRLNRLITGDKGSLIHVIFGAPRIVEDKEARAIRCALDLQQECGGLPFITMQRIGVSTGRVFAGPVGSPTRHDYTTMGDSINLSARLMQNAAAGQILLEAAIRAQLRPEFELEDLGQIMVKGKAAPIPVLAALGVQLRLDQSGRSQYRRPSPLFGRVNEIAAIEERLEKLATGQGSIISLVGEVGLGKTHMLDYLQSFVGPQVTWANGICLAYGQTLAGYLFVGVVRDLIEMPVSYNPEETSRHLGDFCAGLFGRPRLETTYPYLARFMGLPLDDEFAQQIEGLSGESFRWQLFEVIRDMLILLLDRQPVVLALDDLQWADPTSLQLIETVLPLAPDHPLVLLLAMRPEQESRAWDLRRETLQQLPEQSLDLTLRRLDRTAATALINHAAPDLPDQLVTYLVEKGGGNPLFLVELVRALQSRGLLSGDVDLNQVRLDALDLPDSVQGLLLAQIDRLTVEARHTLQMASVIGETFFYRVLAALTRGEENLDNQLAGLEAGKYIQTEAPTDLDLTYRFRHILIQESAYNTLLYQRRQTYHRRVAEALEHLFPGYIAEQAGLLGFHYERAGDLNSAIYYHLQAADQARLLYANQEAETLYHQILSLLDRLEAGGAPPDRDRRAKTYLKLAQVRANIFDFSGAQEFYDRAFDLWDQVTDGRLPTLDDAGDHGPPSFRFGVYQHGPSTLDPGLSDIVYESEIIKDLFEGLVELDAELNVIPAIARRWTVDQAGTSYRFELRPNLKWSDGAPLTAHDFVFAWHRNLHPDTKAGFASQLYVVQGAQSYHQGKIDDPALVGITALDDLNLEIKLEVPAGYFLYLLAVPITFPQPAHLIQSRDGDWSKPEHLICNGPFKIATWKAAQEIILEKNPFYQGVAAGNLQQINLHFIEPSLEHYVETSVDWCRVEGQADLPARYPQEALLTQYLETYFLSFAGHCPPFNQRAMRQAFAQSINKKVLVSEVWGNVHKMATGGIIPPGMPGHSPEMSPGFDPSSARALLQAAYASTEAMPSLTLGTLAGFRTTPQYLQENWQEYLGVAVQVVEMSFEDMFDKMQQGTIQLALGGWAVDYPDPDNILRGLFHSASPANYFGWQNAQFDELVERAAGLTHQQARLLLYHQADRLLVAEDIGVVPLYYRREYSLLRTGFHLAGAGKIVRGGAFKFKNIFGQ